GKISKHKDLSEFDKGQIVMARRLDQSISKTVALVGCSRLQGYLSKVHYCSFAKEGTVVNRRQGHGWPRHMGSEGWPVWSDPTDELLLLKLLQTLMLVLIERCQNTQCITVCCVWGCIATDQPGQHMGPGCTMGRRQASGGSVVLCATFCWENLGPAIHVDVTLTRTTYLSNVADYVHPFKEMVFPDGCGLFQQDNVPCYKAQMVLEWFDEHNEFEVLTWPPNSPDLNPIEHLWDVLNK
ncbi:hypothetical protein QTP86_026149, partial [Hemibagrus guttatus]